MHSSRVHKPGRVYSGLGIALVASVLFIGWAGVANAVPLTGTLNIPGDYGTLAAAIADLNVQGVGAGGVTLNLVASNPETAPAGGYVIGGAGSLVLTSSSASNPVTIQGNGNTITASGALTVGALTDAIFKLIGADWVTITGFTMQENAGNTVNTPAASNNMTEWGVALLHVSTTDGAQNNTIQGNTISLSRSYTNTWAVYANNRHSATSITVTEDVTNNTTGPNNGNKVYGNTISNVNMGVAFIGTSAAANQDVGNDVGGGSAGTGNAITNWGGAAALSGYISNSGTSYCIFMNHQTGDNVSYNTITSAAVSGTAVTFRGIFKDYTATAPTGTFTSSITNNTVTMTSGFTSGTFEGIRSQGMTALSTATININNNTILNCAVTGVSSSSTIIGIVNSSSPGTVSLSNNIVRGTTSTATTGGFTGVSNTGAVVNTINLNSNQIGNASGGAITFSAATSGTLLGVTNTGGASTAALSMTGNDVRGITHSVAGSSPHTYINNTAATLSQNISSNTFTNLSVATTGSATFISNSVTAPTGGSKTINSNSIVTAYNKTSAGGTLTLYNDNASSVAGVVENNNSNNFSNITVTGATTIAGWSNTDGGQPTKTVQNNTFSSWTGGTSAITVLNLNFGTTATTTATGNTISGISGGGAVTGIVLGSSIGTANASQNTIYTLSSTGASAVQGMTSASATSNLSKNKIYDLSGNNASTTVNGLLISGGTAVTASNNLIGDLRATAANAAEPVRGISITSTTTLSNVNVYYNTIYLSASSSGTNFGTTGIFHTTNATATTAALNLRDNIITNLSTPNGTGLTVAYRRSSTALSNYVTASNNNLLYAGAPGATRLIFYDGTNSVQTLGAFQALVTPREVNSVSENPPFLSTAGGNANFLHIDPSVGTQIESGAQTIAGITDDYDGQTRNASTPDIGADEGTFTLLDLVGPAISYTPLLNSSGLLTRSFTAVTVTDPSGVNGTAGTRPRVYYKNATDANTVVDNTSGTNGWKYVEASGATSQFDFTIDYSLLFGGSVAIGNVIQYFVVAQDLAGTPNVGINSGTFAAAPASVSLAAGNFPIGGTIRSYTIVDVPLNGDYTVGTTLFNQITGKNLTFERRVQTVMREVLEPADPVPQMSGDKSNTDVFLPDQVSWKKVMREVEEVTWVPMSNGQEFEGPLYVKRSDNSNLAPKAMAGIYATITAAVADLNTRGVSGPVRFLLLDSSYPSETFPITVNVLGDAPTATNTVTIKPSSGVTTTVSGAAASTSIFKVFNTNYVTIDGSNATAGTTRDLTIENTSVTSPMVVWIGSSGTTPITGGTLKNCVVRNGVNTNSAVVISDGATAGNPGYFSSIEVRNNKVEKAFIGVYATGGTTPANGAGLTYADNDLSTSGANSIRLVGLYMQGVNGATVSGNTIGNFEAVNGENDTGIWLASGTTNATVSDNSVSNLGYTGTSSFAPIGIDITPGVASSNVNVTHNSVTSMTTSGTTAVRGIASPVTGTADVIIQRNYIRGVTNNSTSTYGAYGIDASAGNNHTIKNNFVSDIRFDMTSGIAFSTTFGVFGIRIGSGSGHIVDDNSVNLYGALTGTPNSSLLSAALCLVGTSAGCDIRNNILSNTITGGTSSIAHVSAYLPPSGTSGMGLSWNNNAYYSGPSTTTQGVAQVGTTAGTGFYLASNFNPGATTPPTNLRAYTSTLSVAGTNDNASLASTAAAPYTSSTDLHILTNLLTPVSNVGASIASITDDYDGDLRSATPDIGADEFIIYTLTTAVVGSGSIGVSPVQTAYAAGTTVVLTAVPSTGWAFAGWSGGLTGSSNPDSLTMNADKSVTATFVPLTVSIADAVVTEGNAGPVYANFVVSLLSASADTVKVNYQTADGTATTADSDYTAASGQLVFNPGVAVDTVSVTVNGDLTFEANEVFYVNLSAPVNATLSDSVGTGTINNDEAAPALTINDVVVVEGNAGPVNAVFTVSLSTPSSNTVKVLVATANGTATAGADYAAIAPPDTVTFPPLSVTQPVTVVVNGDLLDEVNETYTVNLSGAVNAVIADTSGLGTITDDDAEPTISINDVSLLEGDSGTTNADFTVTLSAASGKTITLYYATANGTASADTDYVAITPPQLLTFAPGDSLTRTITVQVKGDTDFEANETYFVNLTAPVNVSFTDAQGLGTIQNDDQQVAVESPVPVRTFLGVMYPNPFSGMATIPFGLKESGTVRLEIFDVSGRLVKSLLNTSEAKGYRRATWDGRDNNGARAASGVYIVRLQAGKSSFTQMLRLLR